MSAPNMNGKVPMAGSQNHFIRLGGSPPPARADVSALKAAVRDVLGLGAEDAIVIQEIACAEPGCPPVETVIGVLSAGAPARRWTLHQPLSGLTAEAIRGALTEGEHRRPEPGQP